MQISLEKPVMVKRIGGRVKKGDKVVVKHNKYSCHFYPKGKILTITYISEVGDINVKEGNDYLAKGEFSMVKKEVKSSSKKVLSNESKELLLGVFSVLDKDEIYGDPDTAIDALNEVLIKLKYKELMCLSNLPVFKSKK